MRLMELADEWVWKEIYLMKRIYDFDPEAPILREFRDRVIDTDDFYEIGVACIETVFRDTRCYYNEKSEAETYVFFDPLFDEYGALCGEYGKRDQAGAEQLHREVLRCIEYSLSFYSYDYTFHIFMDPGTKKHCKLALVLGCEFYCLADVPDGLIAIHEKLTYEIGHLKKLLAVETGGQGTHDEAGI